MYPEVRGLMGKRNVTLEKLAPMVCCSVGTLSMKLRGKSPITLDEAVLIKKALDTDMTLEELFQVDED